MQDMFEMAKVVCSLLWQFRDLTFGKVKSTVKQLHGKAKISDRTCKHYSSLPDVGIDLPTSTQIWSEKEKEGVRLDL